MKEYQSFPMADNKRSLQEGLALDSHFGAELVGFEFVPTLGNILVIIPCSHINQLSMINI